MHLYRNRLVSFQLSRHAAIRMQQRAIPHFVIELLLELTDPIQSHDGCLIHRFNADSWAEARRQLGAAANKLDRYRGAYVVVAENGLVVTAAWLN